MNKWIAIAAAVGLYVYVTRRPKWIDDVLMRCYSKDFLSNGEVNKEATVAAADYGVPTKWVIYLQQQGVPKDPIALSLAASAILGVMQKKGAPKNTTPEELAKYKNAVLQEVLAKHKGAAPAEMLAKVKK
jgi:hypothetical protein